MVGLDYAKPQTPRQQYQVIEIEKGVSVKIDDAAIATLSDHPGFVALVNRMKLRKAYISSQLTNNRHESIRDVDSLQHGLHWLGYLESEVNTAIGNVKAKAPAVYASDSVAEEFERVRSAIETIGSQE